MIAEDVSYRYFARFLSGSNCKFVDAFLAKRVGSGDIFAWLPRQFVTYKEASPVYSTKALREKGALAGDTHCSACYERCTSLYTR